MNPAELSGPVLFLFNGDADGIISQHIAELSGIVPSARITGLKREIQLLQRASGEDGARLYIFDINLESNRDALEKLLRNPTLRLFWYDHHESGVIPTSPRLKTRIHNTRGTCTALITHSEFPGADPRWAAMAAFGDNLPEAAEALLSPLNLSAAEIGILREAGELINYNAHGETPADVLFQPLEVAGRMSAYRDPGAFLRESGLIEPLRSQMREDEQKLGALRPKRAQEGAHLFQLPPEAWARRLGSTVASRIALQDPARAVALLQELQGGDYQVSIRAPRGKKGAANASTLALEFPTGGGRALAAGINHLPAARAGVFEQRFFEVYGRD